MLSTCLLECLSSHLLGTAAILADFQPVFSAFFVGLEVMFVMPFGLKLPWRTR